MQPKVPPTRQVIFVGGTSYSGSTLLDMMLAHGPGGFSCGEVASVFRPYRKRHIRYSSHSGDKIIIPWEHLISKGPDNLYSTIFNEDPTVERIIDSSKDPDWISRQSARLKTQGIAVRHVLVWKTPLEFRQSRIKRGRGWNWERTWINYHRHYFKKVDDFASLSYKTLVQDPQALVTLCHYLRIAFFPGKHEYWRGHFQTLFGNSSAKIHLFESNTHNFDNMSEELSASNDDNTAQESAELHRKIYYSHLESKNDLSAVPEKCEPYVQFLQEAENRLISGSDKALNSPNHLKAKPISLVFRQFKRRSVSALVRLVIK